MNALKGKKAVYFTLGCKLNFAETSAIQRQMEDAGVQSASEGDTADLCVVNTCSVTEVADSKCRQAIGRLHRQHPQALIVVTGCYAQLKPDRVAAIPGVGLVVEAKQKGDIPKLIADRLETQSDDSTQHSTFNGQCSTFNDQLPMVNGQWSMVNDQRSMVNGQCSMANAPFVPACACGERTRYFLKVQDGCDYFCTYCTIPFARGRSRNGSIASIVRQAEEVARQGGKEIVLTGVNTGDFGKTTGETFLQLIRALDRVEGIERYRISSIEPNLLTEDILRFTAQSRAFMPHFHIPLQSGSDEVLRLMHRRYDTAFFRSKIEEVKAIVPDAFIGVDVIVGMRGETEQLFAQALRFMQELPVSQYHVFSYSERPGTKALSIPGRVPPQEKHSRSQQVLAISQEKLHTYYNMYKGQTRPVLLEHSKEAGIMHGFTDNYIRAEVAIPAGERQTMDNTIVRVRLGEWNAKSDALQATLASSKP